jgi:glycosyltransferase involved in cell wall biosynthesis
MNEHPVVSIILPFYKQADHDTATILECAKEIRDLNVFFEIISVHNGIRSLSSKVEKRSPKTHPFLREILLQEAGWGRAVKAGLEEARGDYICYTNSARTDMKEMAKLIRYALLSPDYIVKATRISRETSTRKWVSRAYNLSNRFILATPIWDVNATPKIFPRKLLEAIGPIESNSDSIDAEVLYKAHKQGIPIIEIPSNQISRRGGMSTTRVISSGAKMFYDLVKIRWI